MHAAGFNVLGVDNRPQPDYPFPFILGDALTVDLSGFAAVIGSPPCQRWSRATPMDRREGHPDILTPLRERLSRLTVPWILENVPGAPMRSPIQLCGVTLRLGVQRHRLFESNVPLHGTPCHHDALAPPAPVYGTYGGTGGLSASAARVAMGTPWLPWPALVQSIPPAYGFYLGAQLWAHVDMTEVDFPSLVGDLGASVTDLILRRGGSVTADDLESAESIMPRRRRIVTNVRSDGSDQVDPQIDGNALVGPPCRHCGVRPTSRPLTGRWGRYCSHACRQAAYRVREARQGRKR